jgi:hypothetical protein
MEIFYFILIVFLLCLAMFDLMVGVSNNFIGCRYGDSRWCYPQQRND